MQPHGAVPVSLPDLLDRASSPVPWREGDNIPWHDEAFSARMLREHLSQAHDAASRRATTIEAQCAWIHETVLHSRPTRVLDLGCGPGLYTSRLAEQGHTCLGIDYSPAAIAWAMEYAHTHRLACEYRQSDLRITDFGTNYGLILLIYGELNVFPPAEAVSILTKACDALAVGGVLLLEPHTFDAIQAIGSTPATWYTADRGVFADTPYLCLTEHFWDVSTSAATRRFFVVDLATAALTRYAQSFQAYTASGYQQLLAAAGFVDIAIFPSLTGKADPAQPDFCAIVARKR
jgi:SAM-dependent methyltransferase